MPIHDWPESFHDENDFKNVLVYNPSHSDRGRIETDKTEIIHYKQFKDSKRKHSLTVSCSLFDNDF